MNLIMYINERASKYFVNIIIGLILISSTYSANSLFKQEYEPLTINTTRQLLNENEVQNPESNFLFKL